MPKICLVTLGCAKNIVENEHIAGGLIERGHKITLSPEEADVVLIHTCSFVEDARKESADFIKALIDLKKKGKINKVFISGCLVQSEGEKILSLFPDADGFIGTGKLDKIANLIEGGGGFAVGKPGGLLEPGYPRILSSNGTSAYLKVSEGCSHRCSFCCIPEIRGKYISRKLSNIVIEAKELAEAGIREVNLIAQDVTSYGKDIYGRYVLPKLIENISDIEGVEWIRILYAFPHSVTDELISCFERFPKVCKYIDIPLQHISNKILKRMGRPQNGAKLVEKLKRLIPDIAIRTSLIVGFPGETRKDFEILRNFVKEGWFDQLGVFEYSDEKSSCSYDLKGKISSSIKSERKKELMLEQKKVVISKNKEKTGRVYRVLVENKIGGKYTGRAYFQAPEIDSKITFNADSVKTDFVNVLITGVKGYDLIGKKV